MSGSQKQDKEFTDRMVCDSVPLVGGEEGGAEALGFQSILKNIDPWVDEQAL